MRCSRAACALMLPVVLAGLFAACACDHADKPGPGVVAAGGNVLTFTEHDDGAGVSLSRHDTLEVRLSAVPGTGYGWRVAGQPPANLALTHDQLDLSGADAPGAGAVHVFRFAARTPGTGTLRLEYVRPWEAEKGAQKTFLLHVRVQ